jgi:hypothetical protein
MAVDDHEEGYFHHREVFLPFYSSMFVNLLDVGYYVVVKNSIYIEINVTCDVVFSNKENVKYFFVRFSLIGKFN